MFSVSEGRYTCHSLCRDLLHLDCPQNGKRPRCSSASEVRHSSKRHSQVSRDISGAGSILSFRPSVTPVPVEQPCGLPRWPRRNRSVFSPYHYVFPIEPEAQLRAMILERMCGLCHGLPNRFVTEHKALICLIACISRVSHTERHMSVLPEHGI